MGQESADEGREYGEHQVLEQVVFVHLASVNEDRS
jgi:hypothetical protein